MSSSTIESKIQGLEARLKAENRSRERDPTIGLMDHQLRNSPRHGSSTHRPRPLGEMSLGTPSRSRKHMILPVNEMSPRNRDSAETDKKLQEIMKQSGILTINGVKYQTDISDMEHLGELGNGTCGHVVKMLHKPSGEVIAVKQMRRTGNSEENKRIVMDIDVVYKSYDCPYIVQCLGCFIMESEVWICMELMATCFDKLLKRLKTPMPEEILGKITVATVKALSYLKEKHDLIHRDVKPSNILLGEKGNVKLCDFGISGRLVDSKARTKSAGCAAYMAPERIDPPDPTKPDYDIRADVWSLGITLVELALGAFPYQDCKTEFEVVCRILHENPPALPNDKGFSEDFRSFVACCLTKNYQKRPKYPKLLEHPFFKKYEVANVAVDEWFANVIAEETDTQKPGNTSSTGAARRLTSPPSPSTPRRNLNSTHTRTLSDTSKSPPINGTAAVTSTASASNGLTNGATTTIQSNSTFLKSPPIDKIPAALPPPHHGRTTNALPMSSNHQNHHGHFGVMQRSPPDRMPSPRINNSPPDKHTYLDRSRYGNNSSPPESNTLLSGRFSPFHQRRTIEQDRSSQSPPNFHDSGGRFSPFSQRRITDSNLPPPINTAQDGRYSPFQQRRYTEGTGSNGLSSSPYQQRRNISGDGFWQTPISSPIPTRKRYQNIPTIEPQTQHYNIGNTSPIVLQRFYHQQSQLQKEQNNRDYHTHFYNNYGIGQSDNDSVSKDEPGKRRFASYIKLQLSGDRRRNQSPDPPPRLSRGQSAGGDSSQSPLAMRRALLDSACPGSPSLSRRYISPSPPQPPPRRLTESSSVPGSPQHVRARFHYTPEPQRRLFRNND